MQRQMWMIDQLEPGKSAYHLPYGCRLRGVLDPAALEAGFNAVIARHEALRTTFIVRDGEPLQHIHPRLRIAIRRVSLQDLPHEEREPRLQALAAAETVAAFDVSSLPLIRVTLFALSETEHALIVNIHHLVADGLSIGLLLEELDGCYRALIAGSVPRLPELKVQYGDFTQWQQDRGRAGAYANQLEYWKKALDGTLPVLDLPADRPRPARKSFRGGNVFFDIPGSLARELKELGARVPCTPYVTLLAAFQLLLFLYAGVEDMLIGAPISWRAAEELQPLIGNFLNVLALRCDVSGNPKFMELLRRTRDRSLDDFSHGDLPLELLLPHLQLERDPGRDPVFQVVLQMLPPMAVRIGDLEVANFQFDRPFAHFDLGLHLYEETAGGYCGRFEYCDELFDAGRIERMASNFQQLLRSVVANPHEHVSRLAMLSPAERNRVLYEWNDTDVELGAPQLLHQGVEAQARRTPDRVALEFAGETLTYAQLNQRANQLARVLRTQGVGADTLVGVLAERSFEMVVSLCAVLKAGGAYVPLDPSHPSERLRNVLEDVRAPLVLAQSALVGLLPVTATPVIALDASWNAYASESSEDLEPHTGPDDLAYVIFTSGSTGRPKGAMNTHRGICNRVQSMQRKHRLTPEDCLLQKTPFSFDVSVWEFFWPLAAGARLLIARPDGHRDSEYLVRTIREGGVTTLHFVPSMLNALLEEEGVEACRSLRRVFCGGEALPTELQERFFARLPGVELHNLYGPAEAAVDVTSWRCLPHDRRASVPIGRPVANTRIYLLDRNLAPVPIGVPGELCVGGIQVGLGYVNRPELTAERFVADPFSQTPAARMYRTGDLARYMPDGTIEYLGRLDYQVKIRGQRVELGEIEATLDRHRHVKQSVVIVAMQTGAQRLLAYVVPRDDRPSAAELEEHLATTLPQCMVPDDFVFLDVLPLTSSGKIDRKQLPRPQAVQAAQPACTAPCTPTEEMVMRAFRELLEPANFGAADSFFDLGGHSIAAVRLMSRLRRACGLDLPLRLLFERPTPRRLAEAIDMLAWAAGETRADVKSQERVEVAL